MALAQSSKKGLVPSGLQLLRHTSAEEIMWLPGDPGVTYTQGQVVYSDIPGQETPSAGKSGVLLTGGSATKGKHLGTVVKTTVCPANTVAFPKPGEFDPMATSGSSLSLVPVKIDVPEGVPVYCATFASHIDDTVASYSAASLYIAATTGHGADSRPDGGIIYVYEGPGAGEMNVIDDYDRTGGAVELLVQTHRPFNATLTSASKYIVLAGEAATYKGVGFGGRIDLGSGTALTTANGANDGKYMVFMDWLNAPGYLNNLTMLVIPAQSIYGNVTTANA